MRGRVAKAAVLSVLTFKLIGTLEFFVEIYSLAKGFGPFLRVFGQAGRVLFLVTTSTFAVSTGICGVACPLPASRVDKPLVRW